jgi:hypothetical protein
VKLGSSAHAAFSSSSSSFSATMGPAPVEVAGEGDGGVMMRRRVGARRLALLLRNSFGVMGAPDAS